WCNALFNPAFECQRHVVLRIGLESCNKGSKVVRAGAASAVLHSGHHKETDKRSRFTLAHFRRNVLKIVDRVQRWERGIAPAVIKDQLAASRFECFQVRIYGVQTRSEFFIREFGVLFKTERLNVKRRIVVEHIHEGLAGEKILKPARRVGRAGDPQAPAASTGFSSGYKSGDYLRAF